MDVKTESVRYAPEGFWMRLDNAAKIYPAIQSDELTSVFRLSCSLKARVNIQSLINAVKQLENRFPYYKVRPKKGFFWYYLEYSNQAIALRPDIGTPCRSFAAGELIFRVLARENRISVEFSHILTDGTGAFEFLKTLVLTYFKECCLPVPENVQFKRPEDTPRSDESVDAFNVFFKKDIPHPKRIPKSFHVPYELNIKPRFNVLIGEIPLDAVKEKAKNYQTSVTVYLVSRYLNALQNIYKELSPFKKMKVRKVFRIQVPINLRKMYNSGTMRNFSLFVMPEIDLRLGEYTMVEIVKTVHHLMQLETDKKLINKIISRNVSAERNVLLKNTPLFIKSLILFFTYKTAGTSLYSGVITNLGKVGFGKEIDDLIDYFVFIPPPPNKTLKINCGVVGFDNKLILSFGNITNSKELERQFFTSLVQDKIPVKLVKY